MNEICWGPDQGEWLLLENFPAQSLVLQPSVGAVSYTHLDVYKRQVLYSASNAFARAI